MKKSMLFVKNPRSEIIISNDIAEPLKQKCSLIYDLSNCDIIKLLPPGLFKYCNDF